MEEFLILIDEFTAWVRYHHIIESYWLNCQYILGYLEGLAHAVQNLGVQRVNN